MAFIWTPETLDKIWTNPTSELTSSIVIVYVWFIWIMPTLGEMKYLVGTYDWCTKLRFNSLVWQASKETTQCTTTICKYIIPTLPIDASYIRNPMDIQCMWNAQRTFHIYWAEKLREGVCSPIREKLPLIQSNMQLPKMRIFSGTLLLFQPPKKFSHVFCGKASLVHSNKMESRC